MTNLLTASHMRASILLDRDNKDTSKTLMTLPFHWPTKAIAIYLYIYLYMSYDWLLHERLARRLKSIGPATYACDYQLFPEAAVTFLARRPSFRPRIGNVLSYVLRYVSRIR